MKFCDVCENIYYFKISTDDDKSLHYYCRKCGDTKKQEKTECIKEVTYTKEKKTEQDINIFLKYDPTIPYSTDIKCPNSLCETNSSNRDKPANKVIYYRYDEEQLKYMYMCAVCDSSWKP